MCFSLPSEIPCTMNESLVQANRDPDIGMTEGRGGLASRWKTGKAL